MMVDRQYRIPMPSAVGASAGPRMVFRPFHHPGTNRVALDVPDRGPAMAFVKYGCEVPALPQVALPVPLPIHPLCIARMHAPKRNREGGPVGGYHNQMHMIRHQAVSQDGDFRLVHALAQQGQIGLTVGVREKHLPAAISSLSNVMREVGTYEPGDSRHRRSVATPGARHRAGFSRVRAEVPSKGCVPFSRPFFRWGRGLRRRPTA